jgi:hypothetical protein
MAKESKIKNIFLELLQSGYFGEWRTPSDVIKKLNQRGLTIKGRKVGMVCTTLTKMCQDPATGLEREDIPKEKRVGDEKWRFKKVR